MPSSSAARIPASQRQQLERQLYKGQHRQAEQQAQALTRRYPQDPEGWHLLARAHYEQQHHDDALTASQRACELDGEQPRGAHLFLQGQIQFELQQFEAAEHCLDEAAEQDPDNAEIHLMRSHVYYAQRREDETIAALDRAIALNPTSKKILGMRITVFSRARRYATVMRECEALMALKPAEALYYNLVGTRYQDIGAFEKARAYYREALRRDPRDFGAASNIFVNLHYDPGADPHTIQEAVRDWERRFPVEPQPPIPVDRNPARRLRIGLISSGLNSHPVGHMILPGMLNLKRANVECYYYTLDRKEDFITRQLMRSARSWKNVIRHDHDTLEALLREDQLDILIDLSGHNDGNRLPVIARKPAPLIMKWVGGQIDTMGLEAIDYFLSDAIETPPGTDDWYVEKLIRLPDDYICYSTPPYVPAQVFPDLNDLPALHNGYVTLGCLNNPTKLNPELLAQWARLMNALPGSHLLLKGGPYEDESFCQGVRDTLAEHGITADRIELEGPAKHKEFLRTYWRIDIALDPWPYSGGMTTCEALMMGVPVVTHPGPTFAGRHAATHVTNAGFPEWVCESWEAYHARVLELAGDLDALAAIRRRLRQQITASPLCDGKRFAENFDAALRAIWQRYCEDKAPAALTFAAQGECQFEDEAAPVELQHPRSYLTPRIRAERRFNWQLPGKLVVLDNRAKLLREEGIDALLKLDAFGIVAFDPGSLIEKPERFADSADVQLIPHALLGDGQPATLHACLDPALSSTLEPLPAAQLPASQRKGVQVLTKLPISTVALNSVAGLESLDWLILDHLSDANAILEHGDQALKDSLLIQVRIAFQPTHQRQPNLAEVQHWMARHGFRFYRFNDLSHETYLPDREDLVNPQRTELSSAEALFLPDQARMAALSDAQRLKLAFLLHTVFNVKDLTYTLLAEVDAEKAEDYLLAQGLVRESQDDAMDATPAPDSLDNDLQAETLPEVIDEGIDTDLDRAAERPTAHAPLVADEPVDDEVIFVVGCGHTGTTLMACMLGAHPEIYTIQRETNWFRDNAVLDTEYPIEREQCVLEGKTRVCEKTPRHVHHIAEIKQRFPKAKFVAMIRDSKDVIASFQKRVSHRSDGFELSLGRYLGENDSLLRQCPSEFVTVVRYEDLVTEPEMTMRRVLHFLQLDYSPDVLEFHKKDYHWEGIHNAQQTDGQDGYKHNSLRAWQMHQPIQDNRGIWKEKLSKKQIKIVNQQCGPVEKKLNALAAKEREKQDYGLYGGREKGPECDDEDEFIFD
ncbi:sulfotransferase [Halochromatium salexigens]|uniref:protein O-GlcNAc transferase n=1 Tax=Halochromatium salexigens TaxID=49447 RepID=A0AAJ0UEF8_HALSE|nr:sulfotransferase [Halochromatium salexigens]MBK5929934.1 hypothetical protein [Halochromatium salexigens]